MPIDVTVSGEQVFISGGDYVLHQPGDEVRLVSWEDENLGGHSTPLCGGVWVGRQDAACEKKTAAWMPVFF
ncbi:hypothetical protein LQZ19_00600 [Treponema primitia]|uniref:hypothetical protein n=1 Tax=Treponema primitia TaxID=88058 RepID=UPI00397EC1A5